ncbi:MAG: putative porin [Kiritimatiellae bacterium]|nr:putative porin [Kiritimatiellia bacterium]
MMRSPGVVLYGFLAAASTRAAWYDSIQPSADLRYRIEYIDEQHKEPRQSDRVRARVGFTAPAHEEVTLGLRLTTAEQVNGEGDPISGNKALSNFGTKKGIFLDLAYLEWTPSKIPGLKLTGGKMINPFLCVGDYLWDMDYTPEGIAANWSLGEQWKLLANAAYHWIQERPADEDSKMLGGQLALSGPVAEPITVTAGGTVYGFTEMQDRPVLDWRQQNRPYGNTTRTRLNGTQSNQVYATGFTTVEGFALVKWDSSVPVAAFAAAAVNTETDEHNTGWMAGVRIGRLAKPGSIQLGYDYRRLEADVSPGAFADSDSFGGGTDAQGHRLQLAVQLLKNVQGAITYYLNEKHLADPHDYHRLQVDFMAKF